MENGNKPKGSNAFKVLMTSASRIKSQKSPARRSPGVKRKISSSKFVSCPICNTNVLESTINIHLDQCTSTTSSATSSSSKSEEEVELLNTKKRPLNDCTKITHENDNIAIQKSRKEEVLSSNDGNDEVQPQTDATSTLTKDIETGESTSSADSKIDIFAHMMSISRRFSKNSKSKRHRFHLHNIDGKVSWICDAEKSTWSSDEIGKHERWKCCVYTKGAIRGEQYELVVSSSIPSYIEGGWINTKAKNGSDPTINRPKPLVAKPSKLSVPVLKSCLQKAIRRKRPLPACRCAMELMDKSFWDLIRRLPIIILEDSSLHPDFPFLIWLMIAASKEFIPPPSIISKVMRIVFEVASCSWRDDLDHKFDSVDQNLNLNPKYFDINFEGNSTSLNAKEMLMLRSLILRKQYGGMTCDMKMIDRYISKWHARFCEGLINEEIATRCFKSAKVKWIDVPSLLHKDSVQQGSMLVAPLVFGNKPVTALVMNDVTISGIDFHCSNVLDTILQDKAIYSCLLAKISSDHDDTFKSVMTKGVDGAVTRESLIHILKSCMWTFSSGVNVRQSLHGNVRKPLSQLPMYELWSEVKPSIESFATKYISSRLSKC